MTDRHRALIVTLDQALQADQLGPLVNAIAQLRHVAGVVGVETDTAAEMKAAGQIAGTRADAINWHVEKIKQLQREGLDSATGLGGLGGLFNGLFG